MSILSWLFNKNHTIKEPVKTKANRGTWKRCAGTGKSMMGMHKVDDQWFGTCPSCLKFPTLASKRGVARPHKPMTAKG